MTEDFYAAFIPQVTAACAQMVQGNPEPWLAMWSRRDPVSVFGSFGYASTDRLRQGSLIPPELVVILRDHIDRYGQAPDGRLFRSETARATRLNIKATETLLRRG